MESLLFPQARDLHWQPGHTRLDGAPVYVAPGAAPLKLQAAVLVAEALGQASGRPVPVHDVPTAADALEPSIRVGAAAGDMSLAADPQGYALVIDEGGARLRGVTPAGTWHGAQTLRQLLAPGGSEVRRLTLRDWPHLRYRGLFVECKWGPDRMTLEDFCFGQADSVQSLLGTIF